MPSKAQSATFSLRRRTRFANFLVTEMLVITHRATHDPIRSPDGASHRRIVGEKTMKILCATDLLPKTESAIERAAMLAEQLNAALSLIHVVPMGESKELLDEDLQHARRLLRARVMPPRWRFGAAATLLVRPGNAASVLIAATQELKPDLVVFVSHRRRPV